MATKHTLHQLYNETGFQIEFPPEAGRHWCIHSVEVPRLGYNGDGILQPPVGKTMMSYGYSSKHDAVLFERRGYTGSNHWGIKVSRLRELGMISDSYEDTHTKGAPGGVTLQTRRAIKFDVFN